MAAALVEVGGSIGLPVGFDRKRGVAVAELWTEPAVGGDGAGFEWLFVLVDDADTVGGERPHGDGVAVVAEATVLHEPAGIAFGGASDGGERADHAVTRSAVVVEEDVVFVRERAGVSGVQYVGAGAVAPVDYRGGHVVAVSDAETGVRVRRAVLGEVVADVRDDLGDEAARGVEAEARAAVVGGVGDAVVHEELLADDADGREVEGVRDVVEESAGEFAGAHVPVEFVRVVDADEEAMVHTTVLLYTPFYYVVSMGEQRTRRDVLAGLGVGAVAALAGCQTASSGSTTRTATTGTGTTTATTATTTEERTVTDMLGRSVTLSGSVESVIGLGPGGLRTAVYVDATDKVVAVERQETKKKRATRPYLLANPGLSEKPSVGSRKDPDVEAILQADPDVVLWGYAGKKKADTLQEKTGIPVVVVTPGAFTGPERQNFYDSMALAGDVLGTEEAAADLVEYAKSTISAARERAPDGDGPRSFIGYLGRGKHGLLYTQPRYPAFSLTDANNVASEVTENLKTKKGAARASVNAESFIDWDPEYVFVDLGGESYDDLSNPEYEDVTAIANDDVYGVLPTRDYATNFGTSLANVFYVGSVLHPDDYDLDPTAKANEIFEEFVGEAVYDATVEAYGSGFGRMTVE